MKKYIYMAVAAIAALSSCSSDNEFEQTQIGNQGLVFTATMEGSEGTRATYDATNKCAAWELGDKININGKIYSAQEAGTTTTFKADGEDATGTTYKAYFPADLYDGVTATLPAIQTYKDGEFNMPMYATSKTTDLPFKNLCAVLAIKVTSDDIEKLKSIKVASDKKMNGSFTVTPTPDGGYKAVIDEGKGTNAVVLECSEALAPTAEGTTFYIAIPAQEYQYLNIFLSADGKTYTQAMATKKVDGLGEIGRSKIFNIDYAKNATKMWEGNLFVADYNVGATSATEYGGYYCWGNTAEQSTSWTGVSGTNDIATELWGSNWRMPTKAEQGYLLDATKCTATWVTNYNNGSKNGLWVQGLAGTAYATNSIFLPAAGYCDGNNFFGQGVGGRYWSSTPDGTFNVYRLYFASDNRLVLSVGRYEGSTVRAVLEEAESPVSASATTGTADRTGGTAGWVQLWENGPKFAEYNVGANSATDLGTTMTFAEAIMTDDEYVWGANWCTPSKSDMEELLNAATSTGSTKVSCAYIQVGGKWGFKFTGKETGYIDNSVFFPAQSGDKMYGYAYYWSATVDISTSFSMRPEYNFGNLESHWNYSDRSNAYYVRPVLKN